MEWVVLAEREGSGWRVTIQGRAGRVLESLWLSDPEFCPEDARALLSDCCWAVSDRVRYSSDRVAGWLHVRQDAWTARVFHKGSREK